MSWSARVAWSCASVANRRGHDADEALAAIDHRDAADLMAAHDLDHLIHVVVLEAPLHVVRHDVPDVGLVRGESGRGEAHRDVAVRHHADEPAAVADRQDSDVHLVHEPGGLPHRAIGLNHANVAGHHIGDLHRLPPMSCLMRRASSIPRRDAFRGGPTGRGSSIPAGRRRVGGQCGGFRKVRG